MSFEVDCPRCGKKVQWSEHERWRPFCSERCRLIDLGQWANEEHRIVGEDLTPSEDETPRPS